MGCGELGGWLVVVGFSGLGWVGVAGLSLVGLFGLGWLVGWLGWVGGSVGGRSPLSVPQHGAQWDPTPFLFAPYKNAH